jgi:hypothetical protein
MVKDMSETDFIVLVANLAVTTFMDVCNGLKQLNVTELMYPGLDAVRIVCVHTYHMSDREYMNHPDQLVFFLETSRITLTRTKVDEFVIKPSLGLSVTVLAKFWYGLFARLVLGEVTERTFLIGDAKEYTDVIRTAVTKRIPKAVIRRLQVEENYWKHLRPSSLGTVPIP